MPGRASSNLTGQISMLEEPTNELSEYERLQSQYGVKSRQNLFILLFYNTFLWLSFGDTGRNLATDHLAVASLLCQISSQGLLFLRFHWTFVLLDNWMHRRLISKSMAKCRLHSESSFAGFLSFS